MTPYTEAQLLTDSAKYFVELTVSNRLGAAQPRVCHHFFPLDGAPEDAYLPDLPMLLAELDPDAFIDIIGDPVGVELRQRVEPDQDRITGQIRAFHSVAVSCAAVYGGWSYEPERSETNGS